MPSPDLTWVAGASGLTGRSAQAWMLRLALAQGGPAEQVLESGTMQTLGAP